MLSRVGEQMKDLDDVFCSFETSYFVNVVLSNHSALTFLGGVGVCGALRRNWVRSIWIRVGTWGHSSRLTRSWYVWILSIECCIIWCMKWCSYSFLSLHTSCNQMVSKLIIKTYMKNLNQHCQMLECSRRVKRLAQDIESRSNTLLQNQIWEGLLLMGSLIEQAL
jgi:hypothetical protein